MPDRYINNHLTLPNIKDFDTKSLDHLIKYNCEKILYNYSASFRSSDYGVYVGYAGIAYLFFHLYNLTPELKIAGDNVSLLCTTYLAGALSALDYSTSKQVKIIKVDDGMKHSIFRDLLNRIVYLIKCYTRRLLIQLLEELRK
ncbi:11599_t:CDS:2 [Entrophospora sp. SA101]|nr:11599_t:CDS:2 [Entrophospora sp. SA101]